MSIKIGDQVPDVSVKTKDAEGIQTLQTADILKDKKVVLFAVPGAFTPTCSETHLPGFVVNVDAIKAKGVDTIACTSVNDVFVMDAWGKSQNAEHILMLADGNADLAKALGLTLDGTGFGMGLRSKRYAMIINNGVVEHIAVDEKGLESSAAEAILKAL